MRNARSSDVRHLALGLVTLALAGCDGPPARPGETPPSCAALGRQVYAIDDVVVPSWDTETSIDLDLDHDATFDGKLDELMLWVTGKASVRAEDWRANLIPQLAGRTPWLLVVETCADSDDARVRLVRGVDENRNGVLEIAPSPELPAAGRQDRTQGTITVSDGQGLAPLRMLFDPLGTASDPGWTVGDGLSAVLFRPEADGSRSLWLGLAFADPFPVCAPPIQAIFTSEVQAGRDPLELDTDHDDSVSADELRHNATTGLIFAPDVDLFSDDDYWPDHDHVDDHEALTLHVHAHPVSVE